MFSNSQNSSNSIFENTENNFWIKFYHPNLWKKISNYFLTKFCFQKFLRIIFCQILFSKMLQNCFRTQFGLNFVFENLWKKFSNSFFVKYYFRKSVKFCLRKFLEIVFERFLIKCCFRKSANSNSIWNKFCLRKSF